MPPRRDEGDASAVTFILELLAQLRRERRLTVLLALAALLGVLGGGVLHLLGIDRPAHLVWAATTALLLVPLTASVGRSLLRRDIGVDAVALVSVAGALALGE